MGTTQQDVLSLFDHSWARLRHRLIGLDDAEWSWLPTPNAELGLRWRLQHLDDLLRDDLNANLLGRAPGTVHPTPATTADQAVAGLDGAYAEWRGHLAGIDDTALRTPVGPLGGAYVGSSRLAFVLHVADELAHHGAGAALLRDLYAVHFSVR